jgi:DNA-binding response OmpR family regulator
MSDLFDIVIVDIHNPSDQPGSAASFIRKFSASTQILVLSGYADDVARNELLHAGATNVFLKTEPLRHLISALSQIKKKPGKKNLPWDLGIYRRLFRADREKYDHAILLLKDELQAFIGSAGEHVTTQDASMLKQDLHRLIPISRQLKFTVLTDLLASCYQSAEQHHWDEIRNAFPRIKQLIERFLSFV